MNKLSIALAAEFELCEKLADFLAQSQLPIGQLKIVEIYPFNEEQGVRFNQRAVPQISPTEVNWAEFDYALFAADTTQAQHIANAAEAGCQVIDMKGVCANIQAVPVIVPTVNDQLLTNLSPANVIALPDPQVTQAALALNALAEQLPLTQLLVTSLLPASYHNGEKVSQLAGQTARLLNGIPLEENEQRLAFDVFAQSAVNLSAQFNKIFPALNVVFHSVQVPVFYGTAQKITALSDYQSEPEALSAAWKANPLLQLDEQVTPVLNGEKESNGEQVHLHISGLTAVENGVEFWTVADEQRFTLAFLTVKLLEKLIR